MGIILAPSGSMFMLADGVQSTPQIAGSVDIFERTILNKLNVSTYATLKCDGHFKDKYVQHQYTNINLILLPTTSSLTSSIDWHTIGSYISVDTPQPHRIVLGIPPDLGQYMHIYQTQRTSSLTIYASGFYINENTTWTTSSSFASMELVWHNDIANPRWIIKSLRGEWSGSI